MDRKGKHCQLTDEYVTQLGQALPELLNLGFVSLGLVAVGVLGGAFLLDVESQVLEQNNLAVVGLGNNLLNLGADRVRGKLNTLAQELLELGDDGLQAVLGVWGAIGAAQVGHEDDGLGAIVNGMLDGGHGTGDTLVVGDLLVGVEGNVEVDLYEC